MSNHAVLSVSGAHKWLNCLPSARLEEQFENKESEAAEEGTAAHNLCEYKLRKALKLQSESPISRFHSEEMDRYTDAYVEFVITQFEGLKVSCKDTLLCIEEKLDFSDYVQGGFGTGDCIIITDGRLHIIDFKYGMGVLVEAKENPQMMLYALGALETYDSLYDIKNITMTIFQPRRENVSSWTITAQELKNWAEKELMLRAELAFKGEGEYKPGQWCTFCRAAQVCRARAKEKLELAKEEFQLPPVLTDEEIEEILIKLPDLTKWAEDILSYANEAAIKKGKEWQGFKVVEGRSNRKYRDEAEVARLAIDSGYKDIYRKSLITITEMEKLMGKLEFSKVLGKLIYKPRGKLTLVPRSDRRKAVKVSKANSEFMKIEEEK